VAAADVEVTRSSPRQGFTLKCAARRLTGLEANLAEWAELIPTVAAGPRRILRAK